MKRTRRSRMRAGLIAAAIAISSLVVAAPAAKAACSDCPGDCSREVKVLGITVLRIDCV